jgi:hypothetical protein
MSPKPPDLFLLLEADFEIGLLYWTKIRPQAVPLGEDKMQNILKVP